MKPDYRKDGSRGRRLIRDIGPLRLGDRLDTVVVNNLRVDTGSSLARLACYPAKLVFWRKSATSFLNSRCPLVEDGQRFQVRCEIRLAS